MTPESSTIPRPSASRRPAALGRSDAQITTLQRLRDSAGYIVAVVSVAATASLHHWVLDDLFSEQPSLLLFILPVLITAYVGSTRQALAATLLGGIAAAYLLLEPHHSYELKNGDDLIRLLLYLIVGTAVSIMAGRLKAADRKALEAGVRLEAALLSGQIGTWTWQLPDGHLVGDRNLAKLLEISESEAARGSVDIFLQRTHPEDVPLIRERLESVLENAGDFVIPEARIFARDNSIRWLSARGRLEVSDAGEPLSLNGIVMDITERKLAEEELRHSEEQLRLITDALPVLIAYVDADGRYQYNNKGYEEWNGIKREELQGRTMLEALGPSAYAAVEPHARRALQGERVTYEANVTYRTGDTRYIRGEYIPHVLEDGSVAGFYALVEDLSAFKAAESALRASEARFRTMADQAPVLIWISGPDGSVTWFNKPWLDFTGKPIEQELGRGWMDGVHPDDRERIATSDTRSTEHREPFVWEYRLRRRDGEYRWLLDHGVPLIGEGGRFIGFVGSCIDITERRQMEEALREADRRKDEFLATLAHELRNPLAPIRQAAKISKSGQATEAQLQWSYDVIDRQVQHMALLLDDLLDVSRITRGTLVLRRQMIDVAHVIATAVETARPLIDARRHELIIDCPANIPQLFADPLRLAQVLGNLLTNAAKYTEAGGRLSVQVKASSTEVTIAVSDTGVGIAADMLPRIFDMFSQVKSTLQHAEGGLGIGLALSRGLVNLHGGAIDAISAGVGHGSTFTVRLPRSAASLSLPPPEPSVPASATARRRVLIADDNQDAADSLSMLLSLEGHDVRTAHAGRCALEVADTFRPDVALLDIGMPDMNGYEVAQHLRQQSWGGQMLLVAITGWGQEQDRRRSRDAGFDHHLTKPIDPEQIFKLLLDFGN